MADAPSTPTTAAPRLSLATWFSPMSIIRGAISAPALYGLIITLVLGGRAGWLLPQVEAVYGAISRFYSNVGGFFLDRFDMLVYWRSFSFGIAERVGFVLLMIFVSTSGFSYGRAGNTGAQQYREGVITSLQMILAELALMGVLTAAFGLTGFWVAFGIGCLGSWIIAFDVSSATTSRQREIDEEARRHFLASIVWAALLTLLPFALSFAMGFA